MSQTEFYTNELINWITNWTSSNWTS